MLTARRFIRIARAMREDADFSLVVNKVTGDDDAERVQDFLGVPLTAVVPADEDVRSAERAGAALLDHAPDSAAVHAIEQLADALDAASMQA
jgi:MinD-like ATPase involved in chromosome partitioning or flagellar assembly